MLNYLLLVACLCIVVALILYFFYWNRFIASVIGQTIRILYWNQESSSIWVEIGMLVINSHLGLETKTIKVQFTSRFWREGYS
jgi:hypothetical protein